MSFFGRLTQLGRGMWRVSRKPEPQFTDALERELEQAASEQEKERARARLAHLKGDEPQSSDTEEDEVESTEATEPLSKDNPPKKTL